MQISSKSSNGIFLRGEEAPTIFLDANAPLPLSIQRKGGFGTGVYFVQFLVFIEMPPKVPQYDPSCC